MGGGNDSFSIEDSTAEYTAPVWTRSPHANNLDPGLNQACWSVTGYLKPTNIEELYLPSRTSLPAIRRVVCARVESQKKISRETHSLFCQIPATKRSKYRHKLHRKKLGDAANSGTDFAINRIYALLTFMKRWRKVMAIHGPRGNASTVCTRGTPAARH